MKLFFQLFFLGISGTLSAQDCSNYFYLQNNKTVEMTISNSKGLESGKMIYAISDSKKTGNYLSAIINSAFVDVNGRSVNKAVNTVRCENGIMQMDMKMFIPSAQQEQMKNGTGNAADVYLEYPGSMKEGDQLKDGQISLSYENPAGLKSSIEISITERKVEGKEAVTTPAGTWDCFKLSSKNKITIRVSGIGNPIMMEVKEWFAPGFGVVKTESRTGKTEITSIK